MKAWHKLAWVAAGAALCLLTFTFFPVRTQCAPLPDDAYNACVAPAVRASVAWAGRGVLTGLTLAAAAFAAHPWWVRRRSDLVPVDSPALRAELAGLGAGRREPTWLLAPYAYTSQARAFGVPWRPCVRINVGLGILFRTEPARFRMVVARELDRLHTRTVGACRLAVGGVVLAATALPAAMVPAAMVPAAMVPAAHPAGAIDSCLLGYWTEEPRTQPLLLPGTSAALVTRRGAIWSFTGDGVATVYPGDETIRSASYDGTGSIRWRLTARDGSLTLTEPTVAARLTGPDGGSRVPEADEFALPGSYTCRGSTTTAPGDVTLAVLHRIGPRG